MTALTITLPAFLIALFVSLLCGEWLIRQLAALKARQPVSSDAPATHLQKQGTPTMGGLLIIAATSLTALAWALVSRSVAHGSALRLVSVVACFFFAGVVGLIDDIGKARKKQNKAGLSERAKLILQVFVAAGFLLLLALNEQRGVTTVLTIGQHTLDLSIGYYALALLYICGFGNAVNFTDGLDGLAGGTTLIASLALAVALPFVAPEIGFFYGALAGACAGFLWFNAHPARIFMGDTGSLALGMGIAAAAIAAKQELLLFVVGIVYLLEIASMMLQRYVFKYRRIRYGIEYAKEHRVFRRAPLHHHFEEMGWKETRVVARFWIVGLIAAAIGILIAPQLTPTH